MVRPGDFRQTSGMAEKPIFTDTARVLRWEDETRFADNGIVSRTVALEGDARIILFGFDAGAQLTEHTTTRRAIVQILSGVCEFSLAGVPHTVGAGEVIHMPPNLPHALRAVERFSMLLTLLPKA